MCALGTISSAGTACAQSTEEDQAAARSLFEDGKKLLKQGRYAEACSTLEAAKKLYASPGILLNLGDCLDKLGRTASAWDAFGEAATVASRVVRNDQLTEARRRQFEVEPKLTRLTIHVADTVPGLKVTRDDSDITPAGLGNAIPVDPGTHEIRAEAPGHEPRSRPAAFLAATRSSNPIIETATPSQFTMIRRGYASANVMPSDGPAADDQVLSARVGQRRK